MQWKSSTPKHTPEPWRAVPPAGRQTQWTIYEGEGFHAKWVCKMYLGEAPDLEEPYARLIATAPELLRELEKARVLLRLLTVGQVIRAGDEAIEAAGLNRWCMNEGLATGDEPISSWQIDAVLAKAGGRS